MSTQNNNDKVVEYIREKFPALSITRTIAQNLEVHNPNGMADAKHDEIMAEIQSAETVSELHSALFGNITHPIEPERCHELIIKIKEIEFAQQTLAELLIRDYEVNENIAHEFSHVVQHFAPIMLEHLLYEPLFISSNDEINAFNIFDELSQVIDHATTYSMFMELNESISLYGFAEFNFDRYNNFFLRNELTLEFHCFLSPPSNPYYPGIDSTLFGARRHFVSFYTTYREMLTKGRDAVASKGIDLYHHFPCDIPHRFFIARAMKGMLDIEFKLLNMEVSNRQIDLAINHLQYPAIIDAISGWCGAIVDDNFSYGVFKPEGDYNWERFVSAAADYDDPIIESFHTSEQYQEFKAHFQGKRFIQCFYPMFDPLFETVEQKKGNAP